MKKKNVLLAIVGLSPAIITEALYVLTVKQQKKIDEIHIVTTQKGKNIIVKEILGEDGAFTQFCREYKISYPIKFDEKTIYVATDEDNVFLEDIATTRDNSYFPNLTYKIVNSLTSKQNTTVYACLSGGRKTMSFYMGAAMMRFGRERDVLFHVLVDEKLQSCRPKFYFPTLQDRWATFRKDGQEIQVNFKEADVIFAEIPFIRLREKLPEISSRFSYEKTIERDKEFLDLLKDIQIPQFKEVPPKSPEFREILLKIRNLRPGSIILLLGETGTGKELLARFISEVFHTGEIVTHILARSTDDSLFRSELFGYKKGAFTGANKDTPGIVDHAREKNAVLFLDEVDKISIEIQHTLLRFLESREYSPVGGKDKITFPGTIVLAGNNKNFDKNREAGEILDDFYYRISTHRFDLPPLRERREDILPLTRYFMINFNDRYRKNFETIDRRFVEFLMRYSWPGNVRELRSFLERIIPHYEGRIIKYEFIPEEYKKKLNKNEYRVKSYEERDKELLENVLKKHKGNVSAAARELQIAHTTLRGKIKKYRINPHLFKHR